MPWSPAPYYVSVTSEITVPFQSTTLPAGFAAKWQTAGIKFTHRPKINIFAPQKVPRCTDSREIWHSRGASESTWPLKIARQSVPMGGNAAQNAKNFHFFI